MSFIFIFNPETFCTLILRVDGSQWCRLEDDDSVVVGRGDFSRLNGAIETRDLNVVVTNSRNDLENEVELDEYEFINMRLWRQFYKRLN